MDFKKIIKFFTFSVIFSVVLAAVLAVLVFFANIPDKTVGLLTLILSAASVFLGAFLLARSISSAGLLNGLILALIYVLALILATLLAKGTPCLSTENFTRVAVILAAGMLGGVLGINTNKQDC